MLLDIIKPLMVGVVLVGLFVVVPVIAILTEHQRKMARILNGQSDSEAREEIRALREELYRAMPDKFSEPPSGTSADDESDHHPMVIGLHLGKAGLHRHSKN